MPLLGRERGRKRSATLTGVLVTRRSRASPSCAWTEWLFFATAEALNDHVRGVISESEPRLTSLVIDLEGVDFVDS